MPAFPTATTSQYRAPPLPRSADCGLKWNHHRGVTALFLAVSQLQFLEMKLVDDINVCILENYPECSNPRLFYIIPYFCGQHPQCREPGTWALERAKKNVLENYLLVGILEELEDVLLLLERLLPHFFSDVHSIYKSPDYRKLGNMTGTVKKHTPTLRALQVLYQRMKYEYDFYYFIRDQFHLMKKKIGLKSTAPSAPQPSFLLNLPPATEDADLEEELEEDEDLEDAHNWLVQP